MSMAQCKYCDIEIVWKQLKSFWRPYENNSAIKKTIPHKCKVLADLRKQALAKYNADLKSEDTKARRIELAALRRQKQADLESAS